MLCISVGGSFFFFFLSLTQNVVHPQHLTVTWQFQMYTPVLLVLSKQLIENLIDLKGKSGKQF